MTTITVDVGQLAEQARLEAAAHPPRTPARRAAAHLWVALHTTSTIDAARRALADFATPETAKAARELLARLAKEHACP